MPTSPLDIPQELAREFLTLNEHLRAGGSPESALQRLVDLAAEVVPGCDSAALTMWPEHARPRTVAGSDEASQQADQLQYDLHDGPCLEAARTGTSVLCGDLGADSRWPAFRAAALEGTRVRGIMALHLTDHPHPTALNLYSAQADAFDRDAVSTGSLFAAHAGALIVHADASRQIATLGLALGTSRRIGAAVGILMGAYRITEPEAFDLLKRTSNRLNRKLQDIAQDVTDTGTLPGPDRGR